jgi:tetratricopeptide (TPR) repeat protein
MIEHKLLPLAEKYESENAWSEAYNTYTQIYSEVRTDEALEKLAWCASRAELYDDAIKFYILLTEHQPQNAKFLYNVGYQYYATKKWAEANEWFYKALNLHPNYFVVKYRLGYSLRQLCGNHLVLKKNEFWQALKQFSECEKLWDTMDKESQKHNATTFADVCFQKGKLLLERKHLQEAIFYFEKSLFIKPKNNEDCEYQLAKTYFEIGNIQKAGIESHFPV